MVQWFYRDAAFFRCPDKWRSKRVHLPHPTIRLRYGHRRAICGNIPLLDVGDHMQVVNPRESQKCLKCSKISKTSVVE